MPKKMVLISLSFAGFMGVLISLQSCGSKNNPTNPAAPINTPAPTATVTITPIPGIYWNLAEIYRSNDLGSVYQGALVYLTVNGQPLTNVNVVVTGSALSTPVTIPYAGPQLIGGVTFAYYAPPSSLSSLNYQPGQTYTVTTTSGGLIASSTGTIPGNITHAVDGSQSSWTVSGTRNFVQVSNSTNTATYSNIFSVSPQSIPVTAYAGGGIFKLLTEVDDRTTSITGGSLNTGYGFLISDLLITGVTVSTPSPTPTSTVTDTPTVTLTATLTSTNIGGYTSTPTYTPTITSTPTVTGTPTATGTATSTPPSGVVTITSSDIFPGVRYASGGKLWITDSSNNSLQEWTTAGVGPGVNITTFNGGATFYNPAGLGVDPATGNVYVADSGNHHVEVFSSTGTYLATFADTELGGFPTLGVAVNSAGTTVCVSSFAGGNVLNYSIGGTPSSPTYTYQNYFGTGLLNYPTGMTFDSSGDLWVANDGNSMVYAFNISSGVTQKAVTLVNSGTGEDVAVDSSGNVFAGDNTNYEVQEFNSSGQLINIWGHNIFAFGGVSLDSTGTYLYVEDGASGGIVGYKVK